MSSVKIGFIGLGNMGRPMAVNLLKNKKALRVFDISREAVAELAREGAEAAQDLASVCENADTFITMLPSSPHVESLYLEKGGLLDKAKKGSLLIDCSTIAPSSAQKVAAKAHELGFTMVDAPVSGGTAGAKNAALTFIVGGSDAAFERVEPLLSLMGKNIFHAGKNGAGQTAKICNNMLLAIHMIGTSEALSLGVANGMDPKILSDIMSKSSGRNWSLETYNPFPGVMPTSPASQGYAGGFAVDLMAKDLGLAMEAALATKSATPLGSLASELFRLHAQKGAGRLDFSSILQFLMHST